MNSILEILKEGLSLWRTHLDKRKELYEVSLSKRKNKALNYAEEGFSISSELFVYLFNKVPLSDEDLENIRDLHKKFKNTYKKFNKYD